MAQCLLARRYEESTSTYFIAGDWFGHSNGYAQCNGPGVCQSFSKSASIGAFKAFAIEFYAAAGSGQVVANNGSRGTGC
ncbi:hypothetical protein UNH65_24900 [Chitinophaga sp. 180180018-2]|nr:hypothetical protein [Chitinophaga sp. 212800010-3]